MPYHSPKNTEKEKRRTRFRNEVPRFRSYSSEGKKTQSFQTNKPPKKNTPEKG